MTYDPPTDCRVWIAHWQRVGPRLEQIRRHEMLSISEHARRQQIDNLLAIAHQFRSHRPTSGLIELQRFFSKARHA